MQTDFEDSASEQRRHRAAMYVRMSTSIQNYSIQHQCERLQEYADLHSIQVVAMYVDSGRSGLRINGRAGLKKLIDDVVGGQTDFDIVLVYDVSRWGRFQDVDESAHYEFICRRAGIVVTYCAEPFANDGSATSSILKHLKRTMAAEYSRDLSAKVTLAQNRLARLGYKQGGSAGYALRRAAIGADGAFKRTLLPGDRKGAQNERVIFTPGPQNEIETLRRIYALYLEKGMGNTAIARLLNREGTPSESGRPWTPTVINTLLTSEKYVGSIVRGHTSYLLSGVRTVNPASTWIRKDEAFEALISKELFLQVQDERLRRKTRVSTPELLEMLRTVQRVQGAVSTRLIDATPGIAPHKTFVMRFGTLIRAYTLAGVSPTKRANRYLSSWRKIEAVRKILFEKVRELAVRAGGNIASTRKKGVFLINEKLLVKVAVARSMSYNPGQPLRWKIPLVLDPDIKFIITAQLDQDNSGILAYYLLPRDSIVAKELTLCEESPAEYIEFRFNCLEDLFGITP